MNDKDNAFRRILELIGDKKGKFGISILLAILGVACGILPYFAVAKMIVALMEGQRDFNFYILRCLVSAVGYTLKVLLSILSTSISHTATFLVLKDIRMRLLTKFTKIPMGKILDTPSGNLKNVIVDRVEGLETTLAHMIPELTANILISVILIAYLFALDWRMALISLLTLPLGMCFVMIMFRTYPSQYEGSVVVSKRMNDAVVEYVNGIEVIKTFNQNDKSYKKYADAVTDDASYYYNWMKSCQWPMSAYTAICPATLLTILPIGTLFYLSGSLEAADFITIIIISLGIIGPILSASNYMDSVAAMGTVVGEIFQILEDEELIRPQDDASTEGTDIELNDVRFSYHKSGEEILHGISMAIASGTVNALVGPSGSGKSTIAKLIGGYWDVDGGEICIGGKNLKELSQKQIAEMIAYVSQDNYLFDDTIMENIRMGRRGASDEEVIHAAKAVGCDDFIRSLESGYQTNVGGSGSHLSGGERQRIAIARAMLKDAPIIILDEATAYLDPENESVLQNAIAKLV